MVPSPVNSTIVQNARREGGSRRINGLPKQRLLIIFNRLLKAGSQSNAVAYRMQFLNPPAPNTQQALFQ